LELLSSTKGNILDDETLINALEISKSDSKEIEIKLKSLLMLKLLILEIESNLKLCKTFIKNQLSWLLIYIL